ncbi:MAG: hypothetical protein HZC05_00635 [Candidatus Magasanikbacteria bacterium]|nr:hypothetical protein [Candidatus Magasanikbacteria bacterium]
MAKMNTLKEIKTANWSWVHINHPTELEAKQLARSFNFHELDLKDVLPPIQRPKLVDREQYLFMILLYPIYDRTTRKIHPVEIDFFIGKDFLVTGSSELFSPVADFFNKHKKDTAIKTVNNFVSPIELLYEILKRLEYYCLPMSIHISNDIDYIENAVFSKTDKAETINEVLRIKTNIVNFRKTMNRHTRVIQHLSGKVGKFFPDISHDILKGIVEDTEDLWMMLENYQDTIEAIQDSQLALLNYRSNKIMEIFTIFTTIIFASELIISLALLAFDSSFSILIDPLKFISFSSIWLVVILWMLVFFRKRRWM